MRLVFSWRYVTSIAYTDFFKKYLLKVKKRVFQKTSSLNSTDKILKENLITILKRYGEFKNALNGKRASLDFFAHLRCNFSVIVRDNIVPS